MKHSPIRALAVIGAALVLVAGGAIAYAAIPSNTGVFTACMTKSSGTIRLIEATDTCRSAEQKVSWNAAGQPGLPGEDGDDGADGTNGTNGVSGYVMESRASANNSEQIGNRTFTTTIYCPSGKVALGGGGRASLANGDIVALAASNPQATFGWDVSFTPANGQPFPAVPLFYVVWVSCAAINN